jgi:hypothetical protein
MGLEKLSYSIPELVEATGLSDWTIREAIKNSYLVRHFSGTKPIILATDARQWLESLPTERAS